MGEGVCRLNICYKVAAFVIPFNVICNNMTMLMIFLFCLFDPTNRVGGGGGVGGGSAGKIIATMLLHS